MIPSMLGMVEMEKWEPACKPGSVVDSHSSGIHVAVYLERPTREPVRAARCGSKLHVPLFGLAPGGVYPAADVATGAVCSYHTISPLPIHPKADLSGMFSVALSVGSRPPGVTWHPALRSPDFPPLRQSCRSDCLADSQHKVYYRSPELFGAVCGTGRGWCLTCSDELSGEPFSSSMGSSHDHYILSTTLL